MSQDSQSKLACLGEVVTGTTDASVSTNLYFKPTEQEEEEKNAKKKKKKGWIFTRRYF